VPDRPTVAAEDAAGRAAAAERIALRLSVRRRRRQRLFGAVLIGYGAIGIVLFAVIAFSIGGPLERARQLSASVEAQRGALIDSLDQAEETILLMSGSVERMDDSLSDAKAATDRAAVIAQGVQASMFALRDSMTVSIFGAQPLIGLAAGFDQTGQQLGLLAGHLTTIGASLDVNRADVVLTGASMRLLAESVSELTETVREGPRVELSMATLEAVRLSVYAVAAWMALFAVGCVAAGLYLIGQTRRAAIV
jgi:hypothetical protein